MLGNIFVRVDNNYPHETNTAIEVKPLSNKLKPPRQHTLDSICGEGSRSRNPLVCSDTIWVLPRMNGPNDEGGHDSPAASINLFDVSSYGCISPTQRRHSAASQMMGPSADERITMKSFQRRRSIYEALDPTLALPDSLTNKREIQGMASNGNEMRSRDAIGLSQSGLSVDSILVDLDAVKPNHLITNRVDNETQLHDARIDTTELQVFSGPHSECVENSSPIDWSAASSLNSNQCENEIQINPTIDKPPRSRNGSAADSWHQKPPDFGQSDQLLGHERSTGFEVAWLNFTYSIEPNLFEDPRWGSINKLFHKEPRTILKGISGGVRSGQMIALMGPSGAGKTCLLECISGVRLSGIGGKICLRGRKTAELVIVPQYDDFLPQFTVEEIVRYGSKIKNPFEADHNAIADSVIKQLGLEVCRSNNIRKCSGGQRKRVAIAQELVSRPNILVLDEPTSGLDSSCCHQTMRVLREVLDGSRVNNEPMAIVMTIHQPSSKVLRMFDSIYVLGKTGYTCYSGPPDDMIATIRSVTGLECPQYTNPSDYLIEMVSYHYGEEAPQKLVEHERHKAALFARQFEQRCTGNGVGKINKAFDSSQSGGLNNGEVNRSRLKRYFIADSIKGSKSDTVLSKLGSSTEDMAMTDLFLVRNNPSEYVEYKNNISVPLAKATSSTGFRKHPFFWHTWIHFERSFCQSIRDPILNNMRILIHIFFATLLVLLYGKASGEARGCPPILGLPSEVTNPNNENMIDLSDNVGYLFMCIMMITYVSLMSTVLTFPIDIKTVGKEYRNGWYGTCTYFLGRTLADLPFIIIYPVIYSLIVWYLTHQAQDHTWRYFSFTGLIILNAMNSQSFGLILGAVFMNSVTAATFLGPVITIPWYLFTGFTKRVHRLAEPFQSASKLLFTRHIFEGLLDTVYGYERCNCSEFLESYHKLRQEEAVRLGQMISMETLSSLDYYDGLDMAPSATNRNSSLGAHWLEKTVDVASTVFADSEALNLASLTDNNVKASSLFSFGLDFEPVCPSKYQNYVIQDFRLAERTVEKSFVTTLVMLAFIRVLTFVVVSWKIRTRQL